ncbi:hypothetical protein ABZ136_38130, partial [Streptomyces microflavus]
ATTRAEEASSRSASSSSASVSSNGRQDAHALGADVYDMRGVPSCLDPEERAYGLLRWKLGTGGQVVETLGEWERPLGGSANHALHHAFQAYLKRR